uniref:Ankyrin-2-like isoform X12 n=1 Tax=Crassostrea virginica TaxID=6565 RepID=A0A8B8CVM0_CRAVI|nr:ankyrin-2-like isoform X12 [Crassostrea virginica]
MTLLTHSFLISFMVDARGGAMKGRRHSGIRIIIPPNRASMPTRVTCRLIKKDKLIHPIPIGEGEALAARIIEMGPVATKFLGRILIEIPHFASLRGKEREIKIMRSTNGDKWEEHPIVATDDAVQKALSESMEDLDYEDELAGKRVTRILTDDFPRYFALVTKVREEKQWVGEEGLILSSTVVPQVQAVFPKGAVNKNIKVGLQAQPVSPELVSKLLGNRVAVSPIVTLEPRRRRFHTAITLTIPVPKAAQKGMINQYENEAPTLRVMYSIAASNNALREGTNPALWDDLTDQTQLTFIDDCVSFNTNVSGRFMLMDCQNVADACRFATELYREAIIVPYMARFVVFAKRTGEEEGKLRMFCMTDDRIDKTLEKQENFREVARSRDVEVLEGRPQYVEMAGNLIPITKSGDQLYISFKAFRENRLPCLVKIRDRDQEPAARVAFMKEPKVVRGELPQTPICNLNIALPDMSTSSSMEMDPEAALELKKRSSLLREHGIVVEDTVTKAKINLSDVADTLKGDWVILATQLDISGDEIHKINSDYRTVNDQALAMLSLWKEKKGEQATGNELERALRSIKREDVVQKCMYNVECITDEVELAAAKVAMDQSGFDTFAEEIGATQDSMKRNMSLDVQFDEQEVQKLSDSEESESVADSPASAPQAYEEDSAQSPFKDDLLVAEVSERRALAKEPELPEKKKEDFFDLIDKLDKYNEIKEKQERSESSADTGGMDDSQTITEEELTSTKQEKPKSEEIIAKVEELGQNLAPAPAPEPTEDEEGTKTPPPSPVEGEFVSEQEKLVHEIEDAVENSVQEEEEEEEEEEEVEKEETIIEETFQESDDGVTWRTIRKTTIITPEGQTDKYEVLGEEVRAQQAAVNELAARLSTAEETAEHPGETEKHEEVIDSQMVQTSESAARQTTMDVGETDVDTGLPYVADQKEPDMGKLVESLRTDLYEKEKTEKSGNESDVSSIASSDTEGEFNIEPLPSTAPETVSKDPVADRRSSVERKRKRTDSLSSSSLSDVEDNGEESVEENTKVEKEPVKPKSSLHDGSRHEPKTGHVHFRKEDLPSSSSSSSSSSSTEDESNQIDTEAKSPDLATPKIDRMEEFHFAEKPGIERKEEKGSEDKGDIPVKVYKPSLTAQDTIEEGLKMLPDNIEGTEDVKPIADSDVEKQIVKAPAPPKEKESSSSSSSSDEDGEDKRPAEDFREGSVERIERYEEVPPKEQTHARSPTENQEPVQDQELLSAGGDTGDGPQFTKTAKRLKRMSSLQQQEVIDSELVEEEESTVEQVLTDGSKVTRKRFKSGDSIKSENGEPECMELVEEEGPEKEDVKYEENEEILEDGTVHRISRTRRQSLKHVKRTLISESGEEENIFDDDVAVPGKAKEDVIEVFEEPAKPVTQVEEVEVIKNDGRVVKKRMVMNRMVSNVKTFHQSFDDSGNLQEDEYEIEAIIPGTESAFVEGEDTTSSSSSGSSSDDNDENDEEIDVDDLDLVEEDCQSGTTVTSRQVIKQTFTSTTYETESLKEEENSKSVAEIVHMFEKDSQKQNAAKPDIVQISDSDELSEGKVSNIKEQSAMYFAEKEIIIVEKNKSEALTESQNEYTQDDTKPIKVHRMVEIFEKISSQSSVDETGVERQLPVLYDNSNVGFESMSEQNKDIEAEKTQSVDEVDEQELEILGESEETITKNQMREPETQQEMKKPDELKYTNISQEFGIVEETTSPLVIETVSPVAKIVEDIESNVSRIQEATIKEQVVPTEQVTEVHTKDLEPQYLSSSDEIYYEKIVNVSEETQFADEIASSTEEMLEEFEQCYPNKMNATETVENEEKLSSEKDISPECEQQSVVEDICDQNEVSEAAKETLEPTCLSSLSIQIVEQHSDEQLIEEENEMTISKTEVQKISPTSNLEDFSAIESRSDDIETIKYPHTDKEFPPKHDGELSVEETGNKIRTETTGETSIINDFQIVHTLTEISNEQQKEEKHDTMENQDSDTSFEYPLTLQSNEEHDARETRPETHLQQMSVSHDEYEFIDDTNERLPKDVDEIKCVDDEGDEDWELLDKEEIEEALNYPDKEISYSDVGSSEQAFNISSEHPRPCIPVVDMNSESEDDISDDTTEIADRSETCDIESPIEFKQPFEKFEEVSEPKTVQFDNKVLEVKSTSTGIESSVETRDIAKESVTSIEEEDIESISSTEEYKIRKYEYDQEIKEKDTIAKQQAIHLTRLK